MFISKTFCWILQLKDDNQTRLLVHIDPSTAEEKDKQFVYCDLNITVNEKVSEI